MSTTPPTPPPSETPRTQAAWDSIDGKTSSEALAILFGRSVELELELAEANEMLTSALRREQEQRERAVLAEDQLAKAKERGDRYRDALKGITLRLGVDVDVELFQKLTEELK